METKRDDKPETENKDKEEKRGEKRNLAEFTDDAELPNAKKLRPDVSAASNPDYQTGNPQGEDAMDIDESRLSTCFLSLNDAVF
jgi:hypothetical protein